MRRPAPAAAAPWASSEARQLAAQLPREIRASWSAGKEARRRPVRIHRPAFYARVKAAAGLGSTREARALTADDVHAQLPGDPKALWDKARACLHLLPALEAARR